MKLKTLFFINLIVLLITSSCIYNVDDFSEEQLKWTKSFNEKHESIFISEKGEIDTIIFNNILKSKETVNNIERGFYKSNYLDVPYKFTKGSYHQFNSDDSSTSEQDLVSITKSSAGFGSMEITFIGLLFDEDQIQKAKEIDYKSYQFESSNATSKWVNVKKGIKNFTFNLESGILNYTDERNIKWTRK